MNTFRLLTAAIVWGVASSALAVSLGRSQGAAVLGRPLVMSVLVALDGVETSAELCVSADVFYADTRVESSRVRASLERMSSGQEALIRVRSSAVIDEPVVTVHVRAGCTTRMVERRYVLLADPASSQVAIPTDQAEPVREQAARRPFATESSPQGASEQAGAAPLRARKPPPARLADGTPPVGRTPAVLPAAKPAARLKLEPLDLMVETFPQLKASTELLTAPATSDEQRAMAAALWKALTAEPADLLKDAEKVRSMEADLGRLSAESRNNQLALTELRTQLQVQQRNARVWIGALFAALILVVSGFFIWRGRFKGHSAPWWRRKKASQMNWFGSDLGGNADLGRDSIPVDSDLLYSMPPDRNAGAEQTSRLPGPAARPSSAFRPPSSRRGHTDFALSMPHMPRALKAEELFDVQHQAEFFMSIGQHDQAVAVLRNHILEDSQTSALVYLDLFNLYHQLKRRNEFDGLRTEFSRLFNAEIPSFDAYTETSQGLDAYEAILSRIVSLWPDPKVLEVIEEAVFRKPGDHAEVFGLEAYRELLFLYGIAKEIVEMPAARKSSLLDFDLPSLPSLPTLVPPEAGGDLPPATRPGKPGVHLPPRQLESRAAVLSAPLQRSVDIDLGVLGEEEPLQAAGSAKRDNVAVKAPLPKPATAEFGDFNLIDFELSGATSQPKGSPPEKE